MEPHSIDFNTPCDFLNFLLLVLNKIERGKENYYHPLTAGHFLVTRMEV